MTRTRHIATTVLVLGASFALAACGPRSGGGGAPPAPVSDAPGGAELWGLHCGRCHNTRSPTVASDSEWDVIALHMRVRANLTASDTAAILQFLQSGN